MKKSLLASVSARPLHPAIRGSVRADAQTGLAEISKAYQEMGAAFNAFKEKNDERLREIEKKGVSDSVLNEHVDRINAHVGDISTQVDKFIAAQEKRTNDLELAMNRNGLPGQRSGGADAQALARDFYALKARRDGRDFNAAAVDVDRFQAYCEALNQYMRQPTDSLPSDVRNDLTIGSDKDGGYLVSPERFTEMTKRLWDTSPIRQYARQVTISKDKLVLPKRTDKISVGGYGAETTAPTKTDTGEFGEQTIEVHRLWAMPEATQDFLDDADFDVESWLQEEASLTFSLHENDKFVNGTGVKQPRGFMTYASASVTTNDASRAWGVVQRINTGTSGAFGTSGPDKMIDLVHAMKAVLRTNARWAANRFTFAEARKLKDGNGNYLWSMGDIQKGQPSTLLGYPTVEFEDMDDIAANSYSMAFADFQRAYLIVDRKGLTLLRDPYTNKPFVRFYYYKRNGGDIRDFDAIKYLKFAA
jgi:HK97 family phage major capsid protein